MAKLARYHNGSVILELPIIASTEKTLDLAHPENAELPEGADVKTRLKVSRAPIQAEGDLKPGYCQVIADVAAQDAPEQEPDAAQAAVGSDAKGKKGK